MNSQLDPLEDALQNYPLADPPRDFSANVMRHVRDSQAPVKFRLTWLDYALGLFLTALPATALLIWAWLPREVVLRLQFEWLLFQQPRIENLVLISLLVAGGFLFASFLVVLLRFISLPRIRTI
jgi:hypothetical protein